MKTFIYNTKIILNQNDTFSNQSKWKFLKYEILKRSIAFSKALAKKSKKNHALLLSIIIKLEQDIDREDKFDGYNKTRNEIEKMYDNIAEVAKICSKCSWYQYGEKSTKCFCGLEKRNVLRGTIKTLLDDKKEITTPSEISLTLKKYYENLFQKTIANSIFDIEMFLSDIHLPTISMAYSRNLGQRSIFARKETFYGKMALFFEKRAPKIKLCINFAKGGSVR